MVEKYLEKSLDTLYKLLPIGWEKIVLYAEVSEFHCNIFFYVKYVGVYYQCYNLENLCGTTEEEIDEFVDGWYATAIENKKKEEWRAYTLTVNSSGEFEIEYSYDEDDLSNWKMNYLK